MKISKKKVINIYDNNSNNKELRSIKVKKNKENISNQVMGKGPNIEIVDESDDDNEITINDNRSESGNSDKTISVVQEDDDSEMEITPIRRDKSKSISSQKVNKSKPRSKLPIIDNEELQFFTNTKKQKPIVEKQETQDDNTDDESVSDDTVSVVSESSASSASSGSSASSVEEKKPKLTKKEKEKRKQELLIKLIALEKKGVTLTKSYSLKSSLEDIEFEYETQRHSAELEASVHFQQKILMAAVTGVEFLNKKFDPIGAKLNGWSESVMDNINDYEEIFRKLHEKYSERASMPPELQLLVTLVGSGFMFHLTQTLFNSSLPGLGDALKANPDIMQNIMGAMGQAMNNNTNVVNQQNQRVPVNEQVPQQIREQTQGFSGPSLNLSNLINSGGPQSSNVPNFPQVQQSIKTVTSPKEDDRFSIASSESNASEIKTVPIVSGKGKPKGKSIKIN